MGAPCTGVVGHHVHGDFDALPVYCGDQPFERRHPAEGWVDVSWGSATSHPWSAIGETVTRLIQVASARAAGISQPPAVQVAHPVAVAVGGQSR